MGSYTFRWPQSADEVFVTGTFDDWGKTIRLDRKGNVFEKEVQLPLTDEKIQYKFVVDGTWTTDNSVPEEDDGHSNINNVLYPEHIRTSPNSTTQNGTAAIMSGVTPDSTTAALAAGVPKTSNKDIVGDAALSSTAAGSTLEQRGTVPGTFPATPLGEAEQFSVNPIPASSGTGNPISLKPGEKVPDPSTFNSNTIQSTARTDPAGYEQNASYPVSGKEVNPANAIAVPPVSGNMIPESSLPMGDSSLGGAEPYTIQSAGPDSTTAALAAGVPLEPRGKQNVPADDVPNVVKKSISESHQDPEAAANRVAVEEKKEFEDELQHKVPLEQSAGAPAPTTAAATSETAPESSERQPDSTQLSPRATTPTEGGAAKTSAAAEPDNTVPSSGFGTTTAGENGARNGTQNGAKEETKKKRKSWFGRLKEKLK
ncbi:hypothetical protein FE257_007636 [Aspergillus nanangensis]|uniref:AMP-activated protein kinase glycogen-binding domain-containing protein n=1 Tax=Aspergillus nanangensis TaxID=2582783 RepID=A0AAD4CMM6_ASPNN|nr:hypothetical protein FE257_007636 [Aspergillus nanangensis]